MSFSCNINTLRDLTLINCLGAKAIYKQKTGVWMNQNEMFVLITLCCKVVISLNS